MNQTRTWDLHVHIVEKDRETTANILVTTDGGTVITGRGAAHRNPRDSDVPEIGDELAVARALSQVAGKLVDAAAHRISHTEQRTVKLGH
ncbi:MAG: DUF1876 domain-containing protein [Streptosporangiales bacterium]|nr:DUF1876 domain-containing protein [Streptosporangiales bacterium]